MSPRSTAPILRNQRSDWLATAAIAGVSVIAVAGAWLSADIREADLTQHAAADSPATQLVRAPQELQETAAFNHSPLPGQSKMAVATGRIITHEGDRVIARNPDGSEAWSYQRTDAPLCALATGWDKVIASYRTGVGCGDVVSIDAASGEYADTRSAINSDEVVAISSNDRVGTVSPSRVELWRSDLVRTVEFGQVEAKQEPDMQPHEQCTTNSALTRTELLAVTQTCPGDPNVGRLRFLEATPEDSRKPESKKDVPLSNPGSRLVAVGQTAAAVYEPGERPSITSYDEQGRRLASRPVAPSRAVNEAPTPYAPAVADLPHHMSWFDGERLYLFTPTELKVDQVFEQAIGTGVAVGERLLLPTSEGIDVVNWTTGQTERTIPVDRGDYVGDVHLNLAGSAIVESRGESAVVLEGAK